MKKLKRENEILKKENSHLRTILIKFSKEIFSNEELIFKDGKKNLIF